MSNNYVLGQLSQNKCSFKYVCKVIFSLYQYRFLNSLPENYKIALIVSKFSQQPYISDFSTFAPTKDRMMVKVSKVNAIIQENIK